MKNNNTFTIEYKKVIFIIIFVMIMSSLAWKIIGIGYQNTQNINYMILFVGGLYLFLAEDILDKSRKDFVKRNVCFMIHIYLISFIGAFYNLFIHNLL